MTKQAEFLQLQKEETLKIIAEKDKRTQEIED